MRLYQYLKNIYHFFQAHGWRLFYGRPDAAMHVYGVTGTNGKTTTCHILATILQQQHGIAHVGMLTTIAFWIGEKRVINETKMTTLPSRLVFRYLRDMHRNGVTHVVLEMTSHALDQNRLAGIALDGAIVLNIAREHLDYHHTMEEYASAKSKIVNYLKLKAPLVVKGDDEWVAKALAASSKYQVSRQTKVIPFTQEQAQATTAALPGDVNKENTLAASLLARAVGISEEAIQKGVAALTQVPGRIQWLDLPTGARALIDYAVTPDALERLYKNVRETTTGNVYGIVGAAGLRDRGKRPDMARAVAQYADEIIVTREDPWTENEEQIFTDLEKGLDPAKNVKLRNGIPLEISRPGATADSSGTGSLTGWQRIVDRTDALRYLLAKAQPGDVVVATGKGAETGMGIGKDVVPWNEKEIILKLAAELSKSKFQSSNDKKISKLK